MADRKKRTRLLVLPVAGLGIGYLLLLAYLLWGDVLGLRAATPASLAPTPVPVDLWEAYEQAREAAQTQTADARLLSATTQWQAASENALLEGASNWTFVFYSPASGHSLDVVVNAGVARVVNQTQVWNAPVALAEGPWQAGPGEALLAFLACGGREFVDEHPQVVVDLHLAKGTGGGPAWTIVALDSKGPSLLSLLIDAETGQVLSVDAS